MKNRILKTVVLIALTVLSTACSNQWRESDENISADDAFAFVNSELNYLSEDQSSAVYFAQSGESSGMAESVVSFGDLSFAGLQGNIFDQQIDYAGVALVDSYAGGERSFALIIKFGSGGNLTTVYQQIADNYSISDKVFTADFPAQNGILRIRTYDVDKRYSDELAATIHLKAYLVDAAGNETPIGQFSSLRGFGG